MEYTRGGQVKGDKKPLSGIPNSAKQEAALLLQQQQLGEFADAPDEPDQPDQLPEQTEQTEHSDRLTTESTSVEQSSASTSTACRPLTHAEDGHKSNGEVDE